jgi:C-terminal processing protease CtpA/Prc
VGATTFGKGKMQNTFALSSFGLDGAVKFTTHMYYSKSKVGYDGIGIKPDVEVALSEEAKQYNAYELPDEKDDQLREAIKHFN